MVLMALQIAGPLLHDRAVAAVATDADWGVDGLRVAICTATGIRTAVFDPASGTWSDPTGAPAGGDDLAGPACPICLGPGVAAALPCLGSMLVVRSARSDGAASRAYAWTALPSPGWGPPLGPRAPPHRPA